MSEVAPVSGSAEQNKTTKPVDPEVVRYDLFEDRLPVTHFSLGQENIRGLVVGHYDKEDGTRVEIVSPLNSNGMGHEIEVVEGKFSRTLAGQFIPGESVTVKRSDGSVDTGWNVVTNGPDSKGRDLTLVEKITEDGVLHKKIPTETLRQLNTLPGSEVSPEMKRVEAEEVLGEAAVEDVIVAPENGADAARRIIGTEVSAAIQTPPEAPKETEDEMYARFERETQDELHELYARHRKLDPHSSEAAAIENQIRYAKEDLGSYMRKRLALRGK